MVAKTENIFDWIDEIEQKYPFNEEAFLKTLYEDLRTSEENKRRKRQTSMFSHDFIKEYICDNFRSIFPSLKLLGKEITLITGRIDILAKNICGDVFGIELKKETIHTDYEQFKKYVKELREVYGESSKLIILSSSYQGKFLKMDCGNFKLWRYEIFWDRIKNKKRNNKTNQYIIKYFKAVPYNQDESMHSLFADELYQYNRSRR